MRADDLYAPHIERAPVPSVDQMLARKIGDRSRFRSLQIGVSQESFGGAVQKNMSWAGPNRPLPPEEIPHRLFDRLFGAKDKGWIDDKTTILDAVRQDAALLRHSFPKKTRCGSMSTSRRSAISNAPSSRCLPSTSRSPNRSRTST